MRFPTSSLLAFARGGTLARHGDRKSGLRASCNGLSSKPPAFCVDPLSILSPVPGLSDIVFLLVFLLLVVPFVQQRMLSARRLRAIRGLEQKRSSRVITL